MTDKELHRLGRRELLQLLLEQGREAEKTRQILAETETELRQLQETYERLRKRLDHKDEQIHELNAILEAERTKREIEISESGSLAEAALRLNMIFDVAQKAADQYLYNIKRIHGGAGELPEVSELLAAQVPEIVQAKPAQPVADVSRQAEPLQQVAETAGQEETARQQAEPIADPVPIKETAKEQQTEQGVAASMTEVAEDRKEPEPEKVKAAETEKTEYNQAEPEETDPEEAELDNDPKVIRLEYVKAEKIRRAEAEAGQAAQMASILKWETPDGKEPEEAEEEPQAEAEAKSAGEQQTAGAERIREAVGIKISESGMRSIVAELKPQKTKLKALPDREENAMEVPDRQEIEGKEEKEKEAFQEAGQDAVVAEKKQPAAAADVRANTRKTAKKRTFFRQMGKFMKFKVR